jgi:hypothetical protein
VGKIQKVDQWHNEHPDQIDEVPVKTQNLEIVGVVATALVAYTHDDQSDYPTRNVCEVQASDAEK